MYIRKVNFQNFRNFETLEISLDTGFVVLAGPNGAGKTNFLEGICWGAGLRRFPGTKLDQLLHDGADFYRIALDFGSKEAEALELVCRTTEEGHKFSYKYNHLGVSRQRYIGHLPTVTFLPEDLNLLGHSPAGRRRFLDEALSAASADYQHALSQYQQALRQRNNALETKSEVEVWDEHLADYGSQITAARRNFLEFINEKITSVLTAFSPTVKGCIVRYHLSGETTRDAFLQVLHQNRPRDERLMTTSVGPHRDDFEMFDNLQPIVGYWSRGEMRAAVLALKILERQHLEKIWTFPPVLLLDDVFSEFDEPHQHALVEFLKSFEQVFFTTAHIREVQSFLPPDAQLYNVKGGIISPLSL